MGLLRWQGIHECNRADNTLSLLGIVRDKHCVNYGGGGGGGGGGPTKKKSISTLKFPKST